MKRLLFALLVAVVIAGSTSGQDVYPNGRKPTATESVVQKYLRLIVQGALLTPDGWKRAGQLFTESKPYPADGTIWLWSPGFVGEDWVKGENAQVETKWGDDDGSIDSSLRYIPPPEHVTMADMMFELQFCYPLRTSTINGVPTTRAVGPQEWKITGPLESRTATVQQAILYVARKRSETTDPVIRKNAAITLKTLKAMLHRGQTASAC